MIKMPSIEEIAGSICNHLERAGKDIAEFATGVGKVALQEVRAQLKELGEPTKDFTDEMVAKVIAFLKTDTGKRLLTLTAGIAATGIAGGVIGVLLGNRGLIGVVLALIFGVAVEQVTEEMIDKVLAGLEEEAAAPAGANA